MKTKTILLALVFGAAVGVVSAQEDTQRPDPPSPPRMARRPMPPPPPDLRPSPPQIRPDAPGGLPVLPPRAMERLDLSPVQQRQLAKLQQKVNLRLSEILTSQQMEQLQRMNAQRRPLLPPGAERPMRPGLPRRGLGVQPGPDGPGGPGQPEMPRRRLRRDDPDAAGGGTEVGNGRRPQIQQDQ